MNKLEFINELIKKRKESRDNFISYSETYPDEEIFAKGVKSREQEIQILEQIKNDLEAWEIIKPNIQEETQLCESILGKYYRNTLVIKHRGYDSCENKTEYDTLLKALEVKDE